MKTNTSSTSTALNTTLATIALALLALIGAVGCDDDDGYELVPCTTCDGTGGTGGSAGNLNPGGGGTGGDDSPQPNPSSCRAVPSYWDLRSYNGCMTNSDLAGAVRDQNHHEFWFEGKAFQEDGTNKVGELMYLVADGSECGPVTLAVVSNSGTIQLIAGADVDWYLVDGPMAEVIWSKLHGGNAPSYSDLFSGAFSSLLIDIFECEVLNPTCALRATIPGGWPTNGSMIEYQLTGPNAVSEGAFCGPMYVVARSR